MSQTERKFTPISEIDGRSTEITRRKLPDTEIIVDFQSLPRFEDANGNDILRTGIGLNVPAIARRAMISSRDSLRIQTKTGEISSTSRVPVGINPDGSAISGLLQKKTRIATATTESEGRNITININTSEIKQRLKENKIPVQSQEGWSRELNRAIELAFMK